MLQVVTPTNNPHYKNYFGNKYAPIFMLIHRKCYSSQSALRYLLLLSDGNCADHPGEPLGDTWCIFAPTWQPKDGEIRPTFREAGALPHAAPPQPLVLEHSRDRVVIQVLRALRVHGRGHDAPPNAQRRHEEPHHLAEGGGHGVSPESGGDTAPREPQS